MSFFVGRDVELDRLAAAFERLAVALVCGVAGVGKSALASAFAARWSGPVIRTDLAGDSLAELVDDAGRMLGTGAGAVGSIEARLGALAERLDRAAALWLIDDLHRLPPGDRRLCFRELGRALRRARVIATSRERMGVDAGGPDHVELRLAGLSEPDARRLWLELDRLYGPAAGFDAALDRSAGNPFLLRRGHAGDTSDEDPLGDSVAGLSADERRVAGALAVAELALPVRLLDELVPPGCGREVRRRLVDKLIVEVTADGGASMHDLVRDAVLRSLDGGERSDLHAELARLLAGADIDPARRARAVCRHLRALDRHEEAARYLIERGSELDKYGAAGELLRGLAAIPRERRTLEASAALAMASARVLDLERAFAEHERVLGAGVRPPDLVLIHALLAMLTGRPELARRSLDQVERSAALPSALRIRALTIRSIVCAFAGEPGEGPRLLAAAAEQAGDPATAAPLWLYAAFILWCIEERDAEAHEAIVRALVLRGGGALSYRSNVLASTVQCGIAACLGRFAEAEQALAEAERHMQGDDDALLTSYLRHARACLLFERGDWEAARAELQQFMDVFEHGGHLIGSMTMRIMEARILLLMGRGRPARDLLDRCRALAGERNLPGIVRMVDRAQAIDPARLLARTDRAGQAGRPSQRAWDRLAEAIRCAAAGEAGRMSALLAAEEPELARPGHQLRRVLGAIARAVLAVVRGDAETARHELAAAAAHAAGAQIDGDLIAAVLDAVGSVRLASAAGVRVAREPPAAAGAGEILLDTRTHQLSFAEQGVSLLKRPVLRRLLYCLARGRGAVVSKDELAVALWSRPHNPLSDDGTLKSNIANLRRLIEPAGLSIDFDEVGYRLIGAERLLLVEPVTWRVDPV